MKLNLNWTLSVRQTVRQGMRGQHCLFAVVLLLLLLGTSLYWRVSCAFLPASLSPVYSLSLSLSVLLSTSCSCTTRNVMRAQVLVPDVVVVVAVVIIIVILRFTCIFFH